MDQQLELLKDEALTGRLSRRSVLKRSMALGLSAPVIASLLAACGGDEDEPAETDANPTTPPSTGQATEAPAEATEPADSAATEPADADATEEPMGDATATEGTGGSEPAGERGGGGHLQLLWWQAPTILNSHLAQGTKDFDAARPCLEPLADVSDDGSLVAVLADEIPSLENGMVSEDGLSVTWTLRQDVMWHDGEPFNAEDVVFTYNWIVDEGNTATTLGSYENIATVEAPDDYTVVVTFSRPNPAWFEAFVGINGRILPEHIMSEYMGAAGREAPFNLAPTGTGPYKVVEFRSGDVALYEINENYWAPGKPFFDTVEMKGGGDATAAARAALQSGDADYSWNLQVEAEVLQQLQDEGDGTLLIISGVQVERIILNFTDPNVEVDGAKSELGNPHPFHIDPLVRQAFALACDRDTVANQLYGPSGAPTSNWLVAPEAFVSPNTSYEFNLERAAELLDEAGWVLEGNQRAKDGVQMSILYQTSVNSVRQRTQEIIKQAMESLGIPVEIKAIEASIYFSSDAGNPDTLSHFYTDWEMYTNSPSIPYPIAYAEEGLSIEPSDIAQKANDWAGSNSSRWQNDEYNEAYTAAQTELDPDKQAELFITMNDLIVNEVAMIPLVHRNSVSAHRPDLDVGSPSRWTSELYDIANWKRNE